MYKRTKISQYMGTMTLEKLSNPDGSFNEECVPFEEFRTKWLKGSDYEDEWEWAQRRLYKTTIRRLHICYAAKKEKAEREKKS